MFDELALDSKTMEGENLKITKAKGDAAAGTQSSTTSIGKEERDKRAPGFFHNDFGFGVATRL
jgi:hypothetical protein